MPSSIRYVHWYLTHKEVVKIKEIILKQPVAQELTYTDKNRTQLHSLSEPRPSSPTRKPSIDRKSQVLCLLSISNVLRN